MSQLSLFCAKYKQSYFFFSQTAQFFQIGHTPLWLAISKGLLDIVKYLIEDCGAEFEDFPSHPLVSAY
jgi:hypothetical protein